MIIISLILIFSMIAADQITKLLVIKKIPLGDSISILKFGQNEILSFTHVRNTGAAWSSFSSKTTMLTIVTLVIVAVMLVFLFVKPVQKKVFGRDVNKFEMVSFSFIIAGGIGNIIDRIRLREVVDFIRTDFIDFPVFNVADMWVVVGCIMFIIDIIVTDFVESKNKKSAREKDNGQV